MRLQSLSLRTRLVAVSAALVAFGVLATGIATYFTFRGFLYQRLDDRVNDAAHHLGPICVVSNNDDSFSTETGRYVVALDPSQTPITCPSGTMPGGNALNLAESDIALLVTNQDRILTVRSEQGTQFRAMAVFDPRPPAPYRITALPTSEVTGTLAKLVGLELIGGAVVVAAAGVLSAIGVRLGLRPLDRVTRTARTVAAELSPDGTGLDRRVPVSDPDTEVGQLAEAVNTMLDAVETEYGARYESEQRMRRFLADASHELRTPLTSLRGYAELIRLRGKEGSDAEARDALRRIEAEGTRMSRLVDDLLTLARHDRGAIPEREPVELTDLVADAVAGVHAAHPERTITMVDPGSPVTVLGDRDQLLQVVRNVLTNAATHTPDGPITVSVSTREGEAVLAVRDTGPGLAPEQAAQVFDRFWRADIARTRARGGSGLGLSIVQVLVNGHGGRVAFESTPADGTTVTIHLPVGQPDATAAGARPADTTARAATPIGR